MDSTALLGGELREAALELMWRQWTVAGVAGVRDTSTSVIDPEALLVATITLGRYDARLFDEVLDWLVMNAHLLDLSRLRRIASRATVTQRRLLRAVVDVVGANGGAGDLHRLFGMDSIRGLAQPEGSLEDLFVSGQAAAGTWTDRDPLFEEAGFARPPLRLRGLSGRPKASSPACLRFQMRALVGLGSRAEVLTYLFTHEWSHGRLIAERAAYGQAPVARYLFSLSESGLAERREEGKKTLYRLSAALRHAFPERPKYVDWIQVWPALTEMIEVFRTTHSGDEVRRVRLALVLAGHERALRAEGFDVEIGELRGWAVEGPELLERALARVTARVGELLG